MLEAPTPPDKTSHRISTREAREHQIFVCVLEMHPRKFGEEFPARVVYAHVAHDGVTHGPDSEDETRATWLHKTPGGDAMNYESIDRHRQEYSSISLQFRFAEKCGNKNLQAGIQASQDGIA